VTQSNYEMDHSLRLFVTARRRMAIRVELRSNPLLQSGTKDRRLPNL